MTMTVPDTIESLDFEFEMPCELKLEDDEPCPRAATHWIICRACNHHTAACWPCIVESFDLWKVYSERNPDAVAACDECDAETRDLHSLWMYVPIKGDLDTWGGVDA
jgi:hypothetical protein